MRWKGEKLRWTTVFVFTSLALYAIMGTLAVSLLAWIFPWFFIGAVGYFGFLFGGITLIEWVGRYI